MLYSVMCVITVINIQVLHTCHFLFTVLSCVIRVGSSKTVTYHASYIVLSMLSCVIVCYCVFLCVIRVGSSTVTYHTSFTVLSMSSCVIVCYS